MNYLFIDEIDLMGVPSTLIAPTIWGAIRGLETISQLIYYAEDGSTVIFLVYFVSSMKLVFFSS